MPRCDEKPRPEGAPPLFEKGMFCAIRVTGGKRWFDTSTLYPLRDETAARVKSVDKMIPHWAKANPLERIARVAIQELMPGLEGLGESEE